MNQPPRHRTDTVTKGNVRHALAAHPDLSPEGVVRFILGGAWGMSAPPKLVKKVAAIMDKLKEQ